MILIGRSKKDGKILEIWENTGRLGIYEKAGKGLEQDD